MIRIGSIHCFALRVHTSLLPPSLPPSLPALPHFFLTLIPFLLLFLSLSLSLSLFLLLYHCFYIGYHVIFSQCIFALECVCVALEWYYCTWFCNLFCFTYSWWDFVVLVVTVSLLYILRFLYFILFLFYYIIFFILCFFFNLFEWVRCFYTSRCLLNSCSISLWMSFMWRKQVKLSYVALGNLDNFDHLGIFMIF